MPVGRHQQISGRGVTFLSGLEHYHVISSCRWLVERGTQSVVGRGQKSRSFLAEQRHQKGQGFLSEREKAPDLDHVIWEESYCSVNKDAKTKQKEKNKYCGNSF